MPTTRRPKGPPAAAPAAPQPTEAPAPAALRTLKKYPNRRLYDTESSSYITLADVKKMVLDGIGFEVRDAKTAEDLTRSILLQIILEEESGGVPMFSTQTLSQIIRFYGHAMQGAMGQMLEKNMTAFAEMQQKFLLGAQNPVMQGWLDNYVQQSRTIFEQMQKFSPLSSPIPGFGPKK
jgi:polyhydroxyalkanoate synthesis repressor PhaR